MKVIMIECTAEELRANRTVSDAVTDALSNFTEALVGVRTNIKLGDLAEAMNQAAGEEEVEEE